jgi:hypothetical protein
VFEGLVRQITRMSSEEHMARPVFIVLEEVGKDYPKDRNWERGSQLPYVNSGDLAGTSADLRLHRAASLAVEAAGSPKRPADMRASPKRESGELAFLGKPGTRRENAPSYHLT